MRHGDLLDSLGNVTSGLEWRRYASCRTGRRRFDSSRPADVTFAKRICRRCAVLDDCLRAALADPELDGTWGALTSEERVRYRAVLGVT